MSQIPPLASASSVVSGALGTSEDVGVSVGPWLMIGLSTSGTSLTIGRSMLGSTVFVGSPVEALSDGRGSKGSSGVVSGL